VSEAESDCVRALDGLLVGAQMLCLTLTAEQRAQFIGYCRILSETNAKFNLTGVRSAWGIMRTLFLDSLSMAIALPAVLTGPSALPAPRVVDVGAGAGVPGLALKIVYPHWTLTLIESLGKKARFLEMAVRHLGLTGVTVLAERAEEVARREPWRDGADLCLARAVAPLPRLIELCAPLVRERGWLVLPKSGDLDTEVRMAGKAMSLLRVELERIVPVPEDLGLGETRAIVVCRKVGPTPPAFPRRVGLAKSRPIQA
jgi:16S rRNA (guanine527-N7)-methyltransferase